jgi:predicted DNA-binding transcriptional regulator AlpA
MSITILPTNENQLLDARATCKTLSISKPTLNRLMARPDFPRPLRMDPTSARSRLRFFAAELVRWSEQQQARTTSVRPIYQGHRIDEAE